MMSPSNRINMPSSWPLPLQIVKEYDRTNCSIKSEESTSTDDLDDEQNNDGEGVWSPDVEQSFHEALAIYPACGRRKIILSDEGKMFGRNELISRYIKMRTGKTRTRKQVSSHIQVLAKRKSKELQLLFKDSNFKESHRPFAVNQHYHQMHNTATTSRILPDNNSSYYPSVALFSPTSKSSFIWPQTANYSEIKLFSPSASTSTTDFIQVDNNNSTPTHFISTNRLKLTEFSGYIQNKIDMDYKHYLMQISPLAGTDMKSERIKINQIIDLFPMLKDLYNEGPIDAFYVVKVWVNMNYQENSANTYHYFSNFESSEDNMNICVTTRACSFGKTIVEKLETGTLKYNDIINKYSYRSNDTTMCTFMIDFIRKLKTGMYMREMMNTILEHLGVLQTVVSKDTNDLLLCVAYIFEISESPLFNGTQSAAYRLCN